MIEFEWIYYHITVVYQSRANVLYTLSPTLQYRQPRSKVKEESETNKQFLWKALTV